MSDHHVEMLRDMLPDLFDHQEVGQDWDDYVAVESSVLDDLDSDLESDSEAGLRSTLDDLANRLGGNHPGTVLKPPRPGRLLPPDCLAFYLPFHHYNRDWWGVYLLLDGVEYLARRLLFDDRRHGDGLLALSECRAASARFLLHHELFHHKVESFATRLEVAHDQALYRTCFRNLYRKTVGTTACIEESLANAAAYLASVRPRDLPDKGKRQALRWSLQRFIKACPPGYAEAITYINRNRFVEGRDEFAEKNFQNCFAKASTRRSRIWRAADFRFRGFNPTARGRVWYLVARSSPIAARIPLLPQLKPRDVRKKLLKLGCQKVREGANHEIWRGRTGQEIQIPRHPHGLAPGTLRNIIKEAGLNMGLKEFASL